MSPFPDPFTTGRMYSFGESRLLIDWVVACRNLAIVEIARLAIAVGDGICGVRACIALRNLCLVLGHVQAGGVKDVEDVEGVVQADAFSELESFAEGQIQPPLASLSEEIALVARGKICLVVIMV